MKVKSLLESKGTEVVSIDSNKSVEDAIKEMQKRKISALLITEKDKFIGIFTERDVLRCYIATDGKNFKEVNIKDAMISNLIVAEQEDDISTIMSIMIEKNIRHLPVVNKGEVVGILSSRDIIKTQVNKLTSELHYLKDYIVDSR